MNDRLTEAYAKGGPLVRFMIDLYLFLKEDVLGWIVLAVIVCCVFLGVSLG